MSIEWFAVLLLLLPVGYEVVALLSHRLAVIPRLPSYSEMTWKRVLGKWSLRKKLIVAGIATGLYVWTLLHLLWGVTRSLDG
jgi:hypothetical protein